MDEPNFFQALNNFAESVKGFRQSQTIAEMNERAQAIKASAMSDMEKRQQLATQADDVFMRLLSQGVKPDVAQAARASVMPQTPSTAEQAVLLGRMNGDQSLLEVGQEVLREEQMRQYEKMEKQAYLQEQSQSRLFEQQSKLQDKQLASAEARAAMAKRNELKPLTDHQIDKLVTVDTAAASLNKVLTDVDRFSKYIGPIAGRNPLATLDPQFSAFSAELGQFFDAYRVAVTGAGAGQQELAMLAKNVPSLTDTPAAMKKKITTVLQIGQRAKSLRLATLKKAGRDVSGFEAETILAPQTSAGSTAVQLNLTNYLSD